MFRLKQLSDAAKPSYIRVVLFPNGSTSYTNISPYIYIFIQRIVHDEYCLLDHEGLSTTWFYRVKFTYRSHREHVPFTQYSSCTIPVPQNWGSSSGRQWDLPLTTCKLLYLQMLTVVITSLNRYFNLIPQYPLLVPDTTPFYPNPQPLKAWNQKLHPSTESRPKLFSTLSSPEPLSSQVIIIVITTIISPPARTVSVCFGPGLVEFVTLLRSH